MHLSLVLSLLLLAAETDRPSVVLVVGASGAPEFGEQFQQWSARWQQSVGGTGAGLTVIGAASLLEKEADGSGSATPSDHDRLRDHLAAEAQEGGAPLWLVLIGHGTFDGKHAKFNLRGPDVADQ